MKEAEYEKLKALVESVIKPNSVLPTTRERLVNFGVLVAQAQLEAVRNDPGNTIFGRPLSDVQRALLEYDENHDKDKLTMDDIVRVADAWEKGNL